MGKVRKVGRPSLFSDDRRQPPGEFPEVEAFIQDLKSVCQKHKMIIHEEDYEAEVWGYDGLDDLDYLDNAQVSHYLAKWLNENKETNNG